VHPGGVVDIPFPQSIRDALLVKGLAEQHHWLPDSRLDTFRVCKDEDLKHAAWLFRLSYLRYLLKITVDPRKVLDQESEALNLDPQLRSLLVQTDRKTLSREASPH
jgi:Family of unknown function (DUF5519)